MLPYKSWWYSTCAPAYLDSPISGSDKLIVSNTYMVQVASWSGPSSLGGINVHVTSQIFIRGMGVVLNQFQQLSGDHPMLQWPAHGRLTLDTPMAGSAMRLPCPPIQLCLLNWLTSYTCKITLTQSMWLLWVAARKSPDVVVLLATHSLLSHWTVKVALLNCWSQVNLSPFIIIFVLPGVSYIHSVCILCGPDAWRFQIWNTFINVC